MVADLSAEERDARDADALYQLLEDEIVPLFYQRDRDGVPRGWLQVMKETLRSIPPRFSARRMVKEYVQRLYLPALGKENFGNVWVAVQGSHLAAAPAAKRQP